MSKSREALRDNLNVYLSDENDMIWPMTQKNLAINLALQATWPDIKTVAKTSFTLTESSYSHTLTALTKCAPWGPSQVWCATSSTVTPVYREVRGSVIGHRDGTTYSLEFDEDFVDNRAGRIVQVYYDQQYGELATDAATTEAPEAFLMPRAAYELCNMIVPGSRPEWDARAGRAGDYFEVSERERARHQVLPLSRAIGLRWE